MKKNKHDISILKATSYFYRKKFSNVIRILEPEIFQYRDNFLFYYIIGISYLYQNDMESAVSFLKRAQQLDEENIAVLEGLAFISLKKGKFDEALKIYLNIIDIDAKSKRARKGLNFIRKNVRENGNVGSINLEKLLPEIRFSHKKMIIPVILVLSLLSITFLLVFSLLNFTKKPIRPEIAQYQIPKNKPQLIEYDEKSKYIMTEKEIQKTFNLAKEYFYQYRDNRAVVEINRLLNSNASKEIKAIALMLKDYTQKPDFSNIKDSFKFPQVKDEPVLYNGCYAVWKGKIGNLIIGESSIFFDLWIGENYEFEGVVPVKLNFASVLNNGQEIEVLGEISYTDNNLWLHGTAVHKILLQE